MHDTSSTNRPFAGYREWIFGPEATDTRRKVAHDILLDVKEHNYSSYTIAKYTDLLNHELLCHCALPSRATENQRSNSAASISRPFPDVGRVSSISVSSPESSSPISTLSSRSSTNTALAAYLEPCLSRNQIESAIEALSGCLIQSNNGDAPAERELQCRALFSALVLLRAQGVESLECGFYDRVFKNLEDRFKDLHWVPGDSGDLSAQKYHKLQSAYLLSAAAECASKFGRAKPFIVEMTSRLTSFLSFGASVATPATGTGGINLAQSIKHLENAFKALPNNAQEQYAVLFSMQTLVNVFHALNLLTLVAEDRPIACIKHTEDLNYAARELGDVVMKQVASILREKNEGAGVKPPRSPLEHVLVSMRRGPPGFSEYHFVYGFLDLAAQVSNAKYANACPLSVEVQTILANIALKLEEPSFRWKALACLTEAQSPLCTPSHSKAFMQSAQPREQNRYREEEAAVCNFLGVKPIFDKGKARAISTPSSQRSLEPKMSPQDWLEPDFDTPKLVPKDYRQRSLGSHVSIEGSAALSPDCCFALLQDKSSVRVFNVESEPNEPQSIFKHKKDKHTFREARLSFSFLGILSDGEMKLWKYRGSTSSDQLPSATETFHLDRPQYPWSPRCFAIFEDSSRTLLALCGQYDEQSSQRACINLYRVKTDNSGGNIQITPDQTFRTFENAHCNPLKNEIIKSVNFSPDGQFLVCITRRNRILSWDVLRNEADSQDPFIIGRKYAKVITSPVNCLAILLSSQNTFVPRVKSLPRSGGLREYEAAPYPPAPQFVYAIAYNTQNLGVWLSRRDFSLSTATLTFRETLPFGNDLAINGESNA
ncbi:MAG: hypothetical protein M1831_001298 [Alyxoria varia]|nr:MAG: hypothetical protein M1831_001298 [Alyxoria varia]